jgi:hypothetical protein
MIRLLSITASSFVLALSGSVPLQAAAPDAGKVCLNTREILRTNVVSDRSILFYMRDGRVWRNDLRTNCPMLKVSPYTEKLTSDLVCANQQFIHLTLTGDDCALGDFTEVATPPR